MENEEDANLALAPRLFDANSIAQEEVEAYWSLCVGLRAVIRAADPAIIAATVATAHPQAAALFEAVRTWDSAFLTNYVDAAAFGELAVAVDLRHNDLRRAFDAVPSFVAYRYREAAAILENVNDPRPIKALTIRNAARDDDDEINIETRNGEIHAFRRFVTLLAQREGGRTIRKISFSFEEGTFWLPEDAMADLFGDVLPNHRTLQEVIFNIAGLPTRFFRMLTESIPTTPTTSLSTLTLIGCVFDPEILAQVVQDVVGTLRRNAVIQTIHIFFMFSKSCELICQALPGNTNLRSLYVRVEEVLAHTLVGVEQSSLEYLSVSGSFSEGAVASLAIRLRTNTTLQGLRLSANNGDIRGSVALLDLVRTYNYTLRNVEGNLGSDHDDPTVQELFQRYLSRNAWIRAALEELENPEPSQGGAMTPARLVRLLEQVSVVPTAAYKIVKLHVSMIVSSLEDRGQLSP